MKQIKEYLTFDDVLIKPKFSYVKSRKDVEFKLELKNDFNLSQAVLTLPVLSANMDTITGPAMAIALAKAGGLGVLHRFWDISDNVNSLKEVFKAGANCAVSVGIDDNELKRASKLYDAGARIIVLDVAHGAQKQTVEQYRFIKTYCRNAFVIVGNFATAESCLNFQKELDYYGYHVDGFKIGIGPGSACTTRIKTGCGVPQLGAILEIAQILKYHNQKSIIIADGGMRTSGDIAKALAAGADCVMLGGMLAGTEETPPVVRFLDEMKESAEAYPEHKEDYLKGRPSYVKYRGSASKESYVDQGKEANHRTAEGESFTVPYKGPVAKVLQDIEGGLRSAFTYVGVNNIKDFQIETEFVRVTNNGLKESGAHGKSN